MNPSFSWVGLGTLAVHINYSPGRFTAQTKADWGHVMGYISLVLSAGVADHVIMPVAKFIQTWALRACYCNFIKISLFSEWNNDLLCVIHVQTFWMPLWKLNISLCCTKMASAAKTTWQNNIILQNSNSRQFGYSILCNSEQQFGNSSRTCSEQQTPL